MKIDDKAKVQDIIPGNQWGDTVAAVKQASAPIVLHYPILGFYCIPDSMKEKKEANKKKGIVILQQ